MIEKRLMDIPLTEDQKEYIQFPEKIITKRPNGSMKIQTIHQGPSMAEQQYKDECDVNNIIKKYKQTGTITHVRNGQSGVYTDLTELPSYHEAMGVVAKANEAFQEVPAEIRNRFNHDPQAFIEFLENPENNAEAIKMGLKTKTPPKTEDPILSEIKNLNKNLTKSNNKNKNLQKENSENETE